MAPSAPFFFLAAVVVAALLLRHRSRLAHAVGAIAIVGAGVPGFSTFAGQRPSSPLQGTTAAAVVERFRAEVQSFAEAHRCAAVRSSACVACDPVVDFALATIPPCEAPAPILLGPDALRTGCTESDGALICGEVPSR